MNLSSLSRSVKNPFAKLTHCSFKTPRVLEFVCVCVCVGGGGVIIFWPVYMPGFCMLGINNNQTFMILKFRQASIDWEKVHFSIPWGLKLKPPKIKSHSTRALKTISEPQSSVIKPLQKPLIFKNRVNYFELLKFHLDQFAIGLVDLDEYPVGLGDRLLGMSRENISNRYWLFRDFIDLVPTLYQC